MTQRTKTGRASLMLGALATASLAVACGSGGGTTDPDPDPDPACEGDECLGGELDPFRHEPVERLDFDNVMYYSDQPLELLDMPDPPRSGFRLVMVPQEVPAGYDSESANTGIEDVSPCQSWEVPADLSNRWVYTAVLHTTPGLHHANLYGVAVDPVQGPESYPGCRVSADLRMFGQFSKTLNDPASTVECGDPRCKTNQGFIDESNCDISTCAFENLTIPAVLFASSTQVIGSEKYAFDEGYAYQLPAGYEVVTDTHLQNTTPSALHVEAAWDFYTMPADVVTNPTVMFVWFWADFLLPPRQEKTLSADCRWGGGELVAVMPHTHQWATGFRVAVGNSTPREYDGEPTPGTFQESKLIYDRAGTGLTDSDIELYYPPVPTEGNDAIRFECEFNNTTNHDMSFGVGENEMCFLFGYTSPPEAQRTGIILRENTSCLSLDPTNVANNPLNFNLADWNETQP